MNEQKEMLGSVSKGKVLSEASFAHYMQVLIRNNMSSLSYVHIYVHNICISYVHIICSCHMLMSYDNIICSYNTYIILLIFSVELMYLQS